MKLWESLLGLLKKEDKPLHVGEVMHVWKIMVALEEGHAMIMGLLNHTTDAELKRFMESYLKDFEDAWMVRIKQFMQDRGIPLPPAGTDKPKADPREIPPGARFSEAEMATFLAAKVVSGTTVVHTALLECLNYGLATLLLDLELSSYRQSFVLREILERRGWLKVPPVWHVPRVSE